MASTVSFPSAPMFAISDCHGVVIHHSVTWKTHVTGGGGGGCLVVNNGNGYGQVNPRWTRTDHVHRQDFWVRTSDGREVNYWLEGFEDIAIRQGHDLAVRVANGHVSQIINHTTRMHYRVATLGDLVPPTVAHELRQNCGSFNIHDAGSEIRDLVRAGLHRLWASRFVLWASSAWKPVVG